MKLAPALFLLPLLALPLTTRAATPTPAPNPTPALTPTPRATPTPITNTPRPSIPVYEGRDPDQIPDSDTLITQVIPLEHINAVELRANLILLLKPGTPIVAAANNIVVTDTSAMVKRIVQIIVYLDAPRPSDNIIAIIHLNAGNAPEAARQINALFTSQP